MTTTDTSNKPSSDDSKHAVPKKPGLTEGTCATDTGPREASQAQLTPAPPISIDKGSKIQEGYSGKAETAGNEGHKAGPEEPMELDTEAETSVSGVEPKQKVTDITRTPELSLEELSISSRQQQLQASAPKLTVAAGGTDQGLLRKPNRKRKLLEDVESGKTLLLDAYRVWQQGQKVMTYDLGRVEKIMSETYMLIKQVDEDVALDQAVKFCQIQLATSAQRQVNLCNSACSSATPTPLHLLSSLQCSTHLTTVTPRSTETSSSPLPCRPPSCSATPPATLCPPRTANCPDLRPQASTISHSTGEEPATLLQPWPSCHIQVPRPPPTHISSLHGCLQLLSNIATSSDSAQYASNDQSKLPDPSRIRSRVPPNMPKLFIPSTVTKFPPEITVTPPTPTLLSPKGSISEETKQRLKNVILSSQSAATVKKDTLSQPALEVQETSSQESSLESESDEEDDYMDI
uniref:Calcineurin-binding protein cabin-1 MEF2-binding domain-containing protein n=1 Tax=Amphilophus citrinellus TaxID=61819 RepID=A0A3Q0T7Z5_AMPCI